MNFRIYGLKMAGQIYSIQYKTLQTLGHKPFGVEGGGVIN